MPIKDIQDKPVFIATGDGEYEPLSRIDAADIEPDTSEPLLLNGFEQEIDVTFDKAPVALYRIMQPPNNYLRMHGYKAFRYRNLIRARKRYGTGN